LLSKKLLLFEAVDEVVGARSGSVYVNVTTTPFVPVVSDGTVNEARVDVVLGVVLAGADVLLVVVEVTAVTELTEVTEEVVTVEVEVVEVEVDELDVGGAGALVAVVVAVLYIY
jgi:hypothetical protein